MFDNHEEVDAYPVYRDPVHDFGILRFDPKKIKYMPVSALKLRPDLVKGTYFEGSKSEGNSTLMDICDSWNRDPSGW